jgi:DNA repair protein RecN (Recombination protein N)
LKTLAAADATSKTLIFDEIDAGIGGRVATVVGDKLRALGARFQVLCISHLPQIAATASAHFHIEKTVRGARTTTAVARLQDEERIEELARMLAGAAVGESSRATARELLSASQVRDRVRAKGETAGGRKRK